MYWRMKNNNMKMDTFLKRLPPIELSYESMHRKIPVSSDYKIALAIPRAKKYIAWFTFHESKDICFILELTREKKPSNISSYITTEFDLECNSPNLSLGTLFYGSIVQSGHFVVEDLLMYCGMSMRKIPFGEKLGFLKHIFQTSFNKNTKMDGFPKFALPVMWNINNPAPIHNISYTIHHIQYRPLNVLVPFLNLEQNTNPWGNKEFCISRPIDLLPTPSLPQQSRPPLPPQQSPPRPPLPPPPQPLLPPQQSRPLHVMKDVKSTNNYHTYKMFWVTADIKNDIYHLYSDNNSYVDIVYIPNYNTSVYMNSLFRNIRENSNLDFIEESDDEESFMDTRPDKYVDLNKKIQLKCTYNKKFRKWVPYQEHALYTFEDLSSHKI